MAQVLSEMPSYTLIHVPSDFEVPSEQQLRTDLEKGDTKTKIQALKKTIQLILNGEKLPNLLMVIIRFVLPSQDHTLKKLLLIFWEICPKTYSDGKLMQEMILVCDAYRKDLQHPNEFIRGSTLRFLCKLKEPELLEPLMPTIRSCLEHRHSYVRRNAIMAIFTIFKNFDFLIPDAPELIANFLESEQDMSCKRNAFMMLIHADQDRALNYLSSCLEQVHNFGDILQLVIVELIYKVCLANPSERSRFIRCIYNLLNSSSASVRYEAAGTLVTLSTAPTAVKVIDYYITIQSAKINRAALWILGEYCQSSQDIQAVMSEVRQSLGEIPMVEDEMRKAAGDEPMPDESVTNTNAPTQQKLVTADGTYATQSAFSAPATGSGSSGGGKGDKKSDRPPLRGYLMDGDFFIAASIATILTKLCLRYTEAVGGRGGQGEAKKCNRFTGETMLVLASMLHLGRSGLPEKKITEDDADRICLCLKVLSEQSPEVAEVFQKDCRSALLGMIEARSEIEVEEKNAKKVAAAAAIQADSPIKFMQLSKGQEMSAAGDIFEMGLSQALGTAKKEGGADFSSSKLSKITQLTGFSDPVYAEAYVNVNQFDIVLDVLIVNQTTDTLQNCTLELATLGDLKLVERPQPVVLGPMDFCSIKANVKVTSTENGIIFGNIVYDCGNASSADRNVVVLNDVHIDIMDYIVPATCTDNEFRSMWAEFEWENKVSVNTTLTDLQDYLQVLLKNTNMKSLTPQKALLGECGFMAANLYAKSIFGEDALANVSLEKNLQKPDSPVTGHIRIRAKSQGMALSLGDKINTSQKTRAKKPIVTAN
ncbi:coatomer subunit beta-like [Tigriopus californicus]|uniref:coatomer subunit beta-like n=1 Tax=Tigriopus californicus TaxID=6832 RepID=UPI0027DA04DF|nr:coatomer subunit beta-like [Tigriopus californicus]